MTTSGITRNTLPQHPGHEQQRTERGHRRQDRERHRLRDLVRTFDGPAHPVAVFLLVPVDVLAHDDRVVDHDAQHQDEAEQRQHVDRDVEPGISARAPKNEIGMPRLTQNARRSSRNSASTRNTSANPATPLRSISESWLFSDSALFCHTVRVTPSGRRARAHSTYCVASSAISTALWSPMRKTETKHRRLEVEPGVLVRLLEAVDDRRHVAQPQAAAVRARPQDQVLELGPLPSDRRAAAAGSRPRPSAPTRRAGRATSGAPHRPPGRTSDRAAAGRPPRPRSRSRRAAHSRCRPA